MVYPDLGARQDRQRRRHLHIRPLRPRPRRVHSTSAIHLREDAIVPALDGWIATLFDDDHLDETAEALAAAGGTVPDENRDLELRRRLKECDAKLAKYRSLLEPDGDITITATWIAEVERERRALERQLGHNPTPRTLTQTEIKALVTQLRDIVAVLANANPLDRRAIYEELGIKLTHHPDGRIHVAAGARHDLGLWWCRRSDSNPKYTRPVGNMAGRRVR